MKNKKIVTSYACYCSTTMLASKIIKETIEHACQFDLDILLNYLWCCYENDTFPSVVRLERSGGQCHRSPASLLTVISSHCLAASPAKMSAFKSHMRQTA